MNRDIAKAWADRMASDSVRQGVNWLRQTVKEGPVLLCAWGVLCELAVEAGVIRPPVVTREVYWMYEGHAAWPPRCVLEWAEIDVDDYDQPTDPVLREIAKLNDQRVPLRALSELVNRELVAAGRVLAAA